MTTSPAAPEPLSPELSGRLAEFARACKAATRIVSMYPATHPTIQSALARIVEAGKQATQHGPFPITVLPDALLIGGRGLAKPEPSATELAVLLHQQLIRELTLHDTLDNTGWHTFLSLLARSPEETRAAGGVGRQWEATGLTAITLKEIDYAEVLKERTEGRDTGATWDRILALLHEDEAEEERDAMQKVLALAKDPAKLTEFTQRLQALCQASGEDSLQQRKSMLELMHAMANHAAGRKPEELDSVLNNMAAAAAQLTPDMLLSLITDPPPTGNGMDLARELQSRLTDEMISKFLAENIVKDHGASSRLATAFQTLVPDPGRQESILAAAAEKAKALFGENPGFESVWTSSTELLMSYSDAKFVSEGYARELTMAQSQAVDVDQIGDDPPIRIRAWLATIHEEEVRRLDQRLLLDLLKIETRPEAWASVLDSAMSYIDQLVLVGDLSLAAQLLDAVSAIARDATAAFTTPAAAAITTMAEGPMVRHLAMFLHKATDAEAAVAKRMCNTIGPSLVKPMSDAIMGEDNPRTVRRLRDILISFGPAAREYANELKSSRNPAVRRAAIDLLRALGGDAALPDLRLMLDDADEQVQREALRAIVQIGTNEAYRLLEQALQSGNERTREAIMQALGSFRDEKSAPLFVFILNNTGHTGKNEPVYTSTIESLGKVATDDRSVAALKDILYRGEWWAPGRTSRIRAAAARALRGIGTLAADRALEEAVGQGPGGARRAATAALAEPAPRRRAATAAAGDHAAETAPVEPE
jgi:hypothetical protein